MKFIQWQTLPLHVLLHRCTDAVAEKGHPEATMAVKTVSESHQHFSPSLDVVIVPLPVSTVQPRAVLQILQVLGTNRRELGMDGALCS